MTLVVNPNEPLQWGIARFFKSLVTGSTLVLVASGSVYAGSFFADFNSNDAVRGAKAFGDAVIQTSGGVDDTGYVRLTPAEPKKQGSFIIDNFDGKEAINSFILATQVRVGGGKGAEGFSFCYASELSPLLGVGGEGDGLNISFDTFIYASGAMQSPEIVVKYQGKRVEKQSFSQMRTGELFVPLVVKVDAEGILNVLYGHKHVICDLKLEQFKAMVGWHFGFGANCVVASDNHCLDDLLIVTGTQEKPIPPLDVESIASLLVAKSKAGWHFGLETMAFLSEGELHKGILYRPNKPGPLPAVLFVPRNTAGQSSLLPFPTDPSNPFPQLGDLFVRNNYILMVLPPPEATQAPKTGVQLIADNEQQARLLQDALIGLKTQANVDESRVVVMADGSGANAATFASSSETNARAFVLFSPDTSNWADQKDWQGRLKKNVEEAKAPVFLLQPSNLRGISMFSTFRQILEKKGKPNRAELFPSFGEDSEAINFMIAGSDTWKDDVMTFLESVLKAE